MQKPKRELDPLIESASYKTEFKMKIRNNNIMTSCTSMSKWLPDSHPSKTEATIFHQI